MDTDPLDFELIVYEISSKYAKNSKNYFEKK